MTQPRFFPNWEKMTVESVREALERRPSVILPLGVIEQHGYHLPLTTDVIIAREVSLRVGERIGMLVAPAINMAFSGGTLPGTINVSPNVVGLLVGDVLRSLVAQGVRNIFMVLGHGGSENLRALDDTFKLLLRGEPAFEKVMLVFAPAWRFSSHFAKGFEDQDWHAGWVETSYAMALAPELVQMDRLKLDSPELAALMRQHPDNYQYAQKPLDDTWVVPRMEQRPDIRVGVMGAPEKADPELGKRMVEDTVTRMAETFTDLERRRSERYAPVAWTPDPIRL